MNNPTFFLENKFKESDLEKFKNESKIWKISDLYEQQVRELFEVLFPHKRDDRQKLSKFLKDRLGTNSNLKGVWVYFPWNGSLVHMLDEENYYTLRTNRNRDLISPKEQGKLSNFKIGIAGLSIGSNIALSLAHLGIQKFKISDLDDLSTSNLNRVPFGLSEIGSKKSELTAQNLFEIDPFLNLEVFDQLTEKNLDKFLVGKRKLGVVIDALDDFEVKILLRLSARKHRIPVLMFTNLGDGCLVDIERYDKDNNVGIFNGLLGNIPEKTLKSKMTEQDKQKFAAKLVGVDNIPTKALRSLLEIGKTLVGRPQLSSTVAVSSGLAGFIIKKIALAEPSPSGRYLIPLEAAVFSEGRASKPYSNEPGRSKVIAKIKK